MLQSDAPYIWKLDKNFGRDTRDGVQTYSTELNCLWTITSQDKSLTVVITCLKWTSMYDFCVQATAYLLEAPNISKQSDLDDHHPLLRFFTDALN